MEAPPTALRRNQTCLPSAWMRFAHASITAGYSSGASSVTWVALVVAARSTACASPVVKPPAALSLLSFIVSIEPMNLKPASPGCSGDGDGGSGGGGAGSDAPTTTGVLADVAEAEPAVLDAVTTTSRVEPTSPAPNVYVALLAPAMLVPARCH